MNLKYLSISLIFLIASLSHGQWMHPERMKVQLPPQRIMKVGIIKQTLPGDSDFIFKTGKFTLIVALVKSETQWIPPSTGHSIKQLPGLPEGSLVFNHDFEASNNGSFEIDIPVTVEVLERHKVYVGLFEYERIKLKPIKIEMSRLLNLVKDRDTFSGGNFVANVTEGGREGFFYDGAIPWRSSYRAGKWEGRIKTNGPSCKISSADSYGEFCLKWNQ